MRVESYKIAGAAMLFFLIVPHILPAQPRTPFFNNDVLTKTDARALVPQLLSQNSGTCFIENNGQIAGTKGNPRPDIKYYTESVNGVRIYFARDRVSYVFVQPDTTVSSSLSPQSGERASAPTAHAGEGRMNGEQSQTLTLPLPQRERERTYTLYRMDMRLLGASPTTIEREGESEDYTNYYYAHCPNGVTNVHSYSTITYKNVYPNIDLVYRRNASGVKYDLIVNPGGRVSDIRLQYVGASDVAVTPEGKLQIANPLGKVQEDVPYTYQARMTAMAPEMLRALDLPADGAMQSIQAQYHLENNITSFDIGAYDHTRPLVIDPALSWCTFFGGSDVDAARSIAVDSSDDVIMAGYTSSNDFPATAGAYQTTIRGLQDMFVAKFDPKGRRVWATYYGGTQDDAGFSVAVDGGGNIFTTGITSSTNFPVTAGAFQQAQGGSSNAFLVKFDSTGNRQWATYCGGNAADAGYGVTADANGNAIICGYASSNNFPVTAGAYQTAFGGGSADGFVAKFNSGGTIRWASYYGGSGIDYANEMASDAGGSLYVTGVTMSANFPVTAGSFQPSIVGNQNAFVMKLNGSGTPQWSTYFAADVGQCIAVDRNSNAIIAGYTGGTNLPVTTGAFQPQNNGKLDIFVAKFDGNGNQRWTTYYGGQSSDYGYGIAADRSGNVVITGITTSVDFPVTNGAFQGDITFGNEVGFIVMFNPNGGRTYASEFGALDAGYPTTGNDIVFDSKGNIIIGGTTDAPAADFPVTDSAFQHDNNGKSDAFLAKFCSFGYNPKLIDTLCGPGNVTIGDTATGGAPPYTYAWSPGKWLSDSTAAMPIATLDTTILYHVTITDAHGCSVLDSILIIIGRPPIADAGTDLTICNGTGTAIGAAPIGGSPPYRFLWTPATGLSSAVSQNPVASPSVTTTYTEKVTDRYGCVNTDSMTVTVLPHPKANAGNAATICGGDTVTIGKTATGGTPPYIYQWSPSAGLSAANIASPLAYPSASTRYRVTVTDSNGCTDSTQVYIQVNPSPQLNKLDTVNRYLCRGTGGVRIGGEPVGGVEPFTYQWSPAAGLDSTDIPAPFAMPDTTTKYTVMITGGNGCVTRGSLTVFVDAVPKPRIIALGSKNICIGDSVRLTVDSSYASYLWITGDTTRTIIARKKGIYFVTATSAFGCQAVSPPETVMVFPHPPVPQITASGPTAFCDGESVTLSAPRGFSVYLWSTGDTLQTIRVTKSGIYTVAVGNVAGCTTSSAPITVTTEVKPSPVISGPAAVCTNSTISYSTADSAGYTYTWSVSPGGTIISGDGTSEIIVKWGNVGNENVALTEATPSGCTGAAPALWVSVGSSLKPEVSVQGGTRLCSGDSAVLDAGKGFAAYMWSTGARSETITVEQPGSYYVTVSDSGGCSGTSDTVAINVMPPLVPQITASGPVTFCMGDSVTLSVQGTFASYKWSDGETTPVIIVKSSGIYSVIVQDTNGCSGSSASVTITVGNTITPVITGASAFCPGDNALLDAGAGYDTYQWSTGATTEMIVVKTSGTYSVSVTKGTCAGMSGNFTVTEYPQPTATITAQNDTLVASAASTYQWYVNDTLIAGATGRKYAAYLTGSYTVMITDANGCTATSAAYQQGAQAAELCSPAPAPALPVIPIDMPVTLSNTIPIAVDSITFDLLYDPSALLYETTTSALCTLSQQRVKPGLAHITLAGCGAPLAGDIADAKFVGLISSRDTIYTQVTIDSVIFYPAGVITGSGCSIPVTINPLCGLKGVLYMGATSLSQNYPNPFTGTTMIRVTLSQGDANNAQLKVYNMLGNIVADLSNQLQQNGDITFTSSALTAGVYYYVLETASGRITRQMFMVK